MSITEDLKFEKLQDCFQVVGSAFYSRMLLEQKVLYCCVLLSIKIKPPLLLISFMIR